MQKSTNSIRYNDGELESGDYAALTVCTDCNPPLREKDIAAINAAYLPATEAE